ncbi:P-loop NTPase fold protein [Streptomyces sp. NPDC007095]|uniref:P-loop NTPase fold protein n=1 Tax=Streptomyces sp. NPDC007095 TaxID=3154482 RepID=UPI0033D73701
MDGGTIAVCGPRGSGKTTLLEGCVTSEDFSVFVPAPATFTPQDFLVSLFAKLCEQYMESKGFSPPNFTRLTTTQRILQRVGPRFKRLLVWGSYALPAFFLIGLGTFAAIRTLKDQHGEALYSNVQDLTDKMLDLSLQVWRGESVAVGLLVTILGVMTWKSRSSGLWHGIFKNIRDLGGHILGFTLIMIPFLSCFRDPEFVNNFQRSIGDGLGALFLILLLWFVYWIADPGDIDDINDEWSFADIDISKKGVLRFIRMLCLVGIIYVAHANVAMRNLAADNDNPVRVLSVLAGVMILKLTDWRPRPGEPFLVRQCRDQLYRLHTVQSTTSTLTTGTSEILALGTSHATSITSVPPNFPDLVADFRDLLSTISFSHSLRGKRTIVAIDELDRLGSDSQALSFLTEIKAIFGVPNVHYLISVAEDVGAAFVRRGLPYRDATDSSLDDVVNVQPGTLDQSTRILQKRAPGISDPYVMLVHALSGGIARDLVRYGRRVMETEATTRTGELAQISRRLILEELFETLSGFRVLLSRQEWTEDASPLLESFRKLMRRLRSGTTDFQGLHRDLSDFAERRREFDLSEERLELPVETYRLLLEASVYAYYSLTMLDIFGVEGFTRRSRGAALHTDGDPQLLAEARQELAISPYTARALLRSIRRAWGLPIRPEADRSRGASRNGHLPGQQTS